MGTFRYYCCPTGLIKPTEIPAKWGLIYVDEKGRTRCIVDPRKGYYFSNNPNRFDKDIEAENQFMYWALRRISVRGGLILAYSEKQQAVFTNENTDGYETETANH